jgi:prevent-host-death family protein
MTGLFHGGTSLESVGAHEARTHLPQLLDRVARGEEIQITRNGRPVARLVPEPAVETPDVLAVIARIKAFRKGRKLGGLTIRELAEEGRRS